MYGKARLDKRGKARLIGGHDITRLVADKKKHGKGIYDDGEVGWKASAEYDDDDDERQAQP